LEGGAVVNEGAGVAGLGEMAAVWNGLVTIYLEKPSFGFKHTRFATGLRQLVSTIDSKYDR
jgi:hypothetical protein